MKNTEKLLSHCPTLSALLAARKDVQAVPDRVQQLAAGLTTATTIAQIRSVAKQILEETGGGDTDE